MEATKPNPHHYSPISPSPDQAHRAHSQNYVVLPLFYSPTRRCTTTTATISIATTLVLLFIVSIFVFWPSDPDIKIIRLTLIKVRIHTLPHIAVDVALAVTVKVRNLDFYSVEYRNLDVAVGYRGKVLGHVMSRGGHVRARGSSYVDATVEFDGVEVLSDWMYLLDDLAKGSIPLDTVTQVSGWIGLFFFEIPLQAKISCELDVNIKNQTVIRQNCYPK